MVLMIQNRICLGAPGYPGYDHMGSALGAAAPLRGPDHGLGCLCAGWLNRTAKDPQAGAQSTEKDPRDGAGRSLWVTDAGWFKLWGLGGESRDQSRN